MEGRQGMTSSRELAKSGSKEPTSSELLSSQLNDFHLIDPACPTFLPPKSRPLSELNFFNKAQEDQKRRKSFHVINEVVKQKFFYQPQNAILYYFKNNIRNSPLSELEAFCCDCYRLLIPEKVPSAHAYFDDTRDYKFVGLTSKNILDFESNRSDPLLEKDTIIEFIENNGSYQRHLLIENIKLLVKCLNRNTVDPQSGYLSRLAQYTKNQVNFYKNRFDFYFDISPTAIWLGSLLENFLKPNADYSASALENLVKFLEDRKKFLDKQTASLVSNKKENPIAHPEQKDASSKIEKIQPSIAEQKDDARKYEYELHLVNSIIHSARTLLTLTQQGDIQELPIEAIKQLEEVDKLAKKNGYDLDKMDRCHILNERMANKNFQISVADLINYRIVKGLAMGLPARYVFEEGDNHNRNIAKDGTLIDFDMSLWPILSKFKDIYFIDRWLRGRLPDENSFVITANDIRRFPDIQDSLRGFYYWPTKITYLTKSMIDTMSAIYDAAENLFTRHDNEIFQKLAIHPVFIFHKFKTLLKYLLTTDQMYRALAELNIRKDLAVKDEKTGSTKNLIDEVANHEASRVQQLRKILITMPEFQEFLFQNGEYVFASIQEEFIEYKTLYSEKSIKRSYYRDLVNSINISAIKKEYEQIYRDTLNEKIIRESTTEPNIRHSA